MYDTPIKGEGLKWSPASFKRNNTLPVINSLAMGRILAPAEIFD